MDVILGNAAADSLGAAIEINVTPKNKLREMDRLDFIIGVPLS